MKIDTAVKLAIANVVKEGLTDIFPEPYEVTLLKSREFQKTVKLEALKAISGNSLESLRVSPLEHVLLPKTAAFDFRRCALIQPMDTIKYLALAISFASEIERSRPAKARHMVYSYRFAPRKGYLFDTKYNYTSFSKHIQKKAKHSRTKVLVSCDIANFYDRLNIHRLESVLLSLALDKSRVRLVDELLLFWANRDSYGLPVGSNASRILAEAALLEVDNYLMSIGANFCRFVDDYRLFAPDAHVAHRWLTQLIERLWLEGLTINKAKTKIEDVSEWKSDSKGTTKREEKEEGGKEASSETAKTSKTAPPFKIIAGYGGTIPTKFRKSTATEIKRFRTIDPEALLKRIRSSRLVSSEDIHTFVRSALYGKKLELFTEIPTVLDKFPQFTPYIVDMLIKHKDEISDSTRSSIRCALVSRLRSEKYLPEYLAIAIIRLIGTDGYVDAEALFEQFRALRRNAGAYIGRALLDSLEKSVSRGQVLEIRNYFTRADSWEKREIVRIVDRHLQEDEKRPWLKNVKMQESADLFLMEAISPITIKKRKKK